MKSTSNHMFGITLVIFENFEIASVFYSSNFNISKINPGNLSQMFLQNTWLLARIKNMIRYLSTLWKTDKFIISFLLFSQKKWKKYIFQSYSNIYTRMRGSIQTGKEFWEALFGVFLEVILIFSRLKKVHETQITFF